ncbi:hypothetical protein KKI22_01580 [Patescibacteria group bacterium]|nr:hypothetical protein [Patescibacteria group bacterium]
MTKLYEPKIAKNLINWDSLLNSYYETFSVSDVWNLSQQMNQSEIDSFKDKYRSFSFLNLDELKENSVAEKYNLEWLFESINKNIVLDFNPLSLELSQESFNKILIDIEDKDPVIPKSLLDAWNDYRESI